MKFGCSECSYSCGLRSGMLRHINRKNKCGKNPVLIEIPIEIICSYCDKQLSTQPNLFRHTKVCKIRKKTVEEQLREKDEKIRSLENELVYVKNNKSIIINNNINNVNINISPWNNPKLPENIDSIYKESIRKIFLSIPTLIDRLHFNENIPENHNIYLSNIRNNLAKVFTGERWEIMDEGRVIDHLIYDYERMLEDWAESKEDNPVYMDMVNKYKKIKERDGEDRVAQDLKVEIKHLLYNRRAMIKNKIN